MHCRPGHETTWADVVEFPLLPGGLEEKEDLDGVGDDTEQVLREAL
jgi:hypothetical protein